MTTVFLPSRGLCKICEEPHVFAVLAAAIAAACGAIKGYSNYLDSASRAARFMKTGGWIGIGLAGLNTTNEVYNACTSGRKQQCGKIAVKGYGNFAASTATGIVGGRFGSAIGMGACAIVSGSVSVGIGALACGVAGAAIGGATGSAVGGYAADYLTDFIWGE
ncbi:hypothetical protein [Serratia odorifera]|uniref:Uncharacterized protein n=1 Tax=Serratia odorifera DSM 4582 TaxID=667129 RepID=D4DXM5_SEROD|nr:hypothetical protein [Serratia odorifera]EFE97768.1 hypothetical protein HMPREF0758_0675 [Serratia odorifera DSM 4582]